MKKNDNFEQKLLEKIKEQKIEPKPRWHFLIKDYVIWIVGGISLFIGSLAVSVMIYLLKNSDLDVYHQVGGGIAEFFLLTLPYFWILILSFFIFIFYFNLKHTKKGYSYSLPVITAIIILTSVFFGLIFFKIGLGEKIDDILGENAPLYSKIINRNINFWNNPEQGRLAGLIISLLDENKFLLLDIEKKEWNVLNKNNKKIFSEFIEVGRPIRLIGEKMSDNEFYANDFMDAGPGRKFLMREGENHFPSPPNLPIDFNSLKGIEEFRNILEEYPELRFFLDPNKFELLNEFQKK